MKKINKIIFSKHMILKLQYNYIKLLIELAGKIMVRVQRIARQIPWFISVSLRSVQLYESRKFPLTRLPERAVE